MEENAYHVNTSASENGLDQAYNQRLMPLSAPKGWLTYGYDEDLIYDLWQP